MRQGGELKASRAAQRRLTATATPSKATTTTTTTATHTLPLATIKRTTSVAAYENEDSNQLRRQCAYLQQPLSMAEQLTRAPVCP